MSEVNRGNGPRWPGHLGLVGTAFAFAVLLALMPATLRAIAPEDAEAEPEPEVQPAQVTDRPEFMVNAVATPPATGAVLLTLVDAEQRSLANNKALAVRKLDPAIASENVEVERGVFDKVITFETQAQEIETPTGTTLLGASVSDVETQFANLGASKKFESGAVASVHFENQRLRTNSSFQVINPEYSSTAVVSVTQPLARDAGRRVNTARLAIAGNALEQERMRLRKIAIDTIAAVEKQYWELEFARKDRDVKAGAESSARSLAAFNRLRRQNGLGTDADVVEALAAAAARVEDIAVADRQVADAEEALRRLVGLENRVGGTAIQPVDPVPALPAGVSVTYALSIALAKRPDYQAALIELKNRDIRVVFLENQTRARVDLVASYAQNGLSDRFGSALEQVVDGDFHSYALGVKVELPVENRTARAEYRTGQLQRQQALLALKALEDQIDEEVTRAGRAVQTDQRRVDATRSAEALTLQQMRLAGQRFQQGLLSNIDLLRFQQDLATAHSRVLRAVYDLVKSCIDLEAATGALLDIRRIAVLPSVAVGPVARAPGSGS